MWFPGAIGKPTEPKGGPSPRVYPSIQPISVSDFVNGQYSLQGQLSTFAELWEDRPVFGPGLGYHPANIVPGVGYTLTGDVSLLSDYPREQCFLAAQPSLLDAIDIPNGIMVVIDFSNTKEVDMSAVCQVVTAKSVDFDPSWAFSGSTYIKAAGGPRDQGDWNLGDNLDGIQENYMAPGAHRAAFQFKEGLHAISMDGGPVHTWANAQTGVGQDTLWLSTIISHSYAPTTDTGSATATIKRVAFYRPVEAELVTELTSYRP